jgi:hypothetical protein
MTTTDPRPGTGALTRNEQRPPRMPPPTGRNCASAQQNQHHHGSTTAPTTHDHITSLCRQVQTTARLGAVHAQRQFTGAHHVARGWHGVVCHTGGKNVVCGRAAHTIPDRHARRCPLCISGSDGARALSETWLRRLDTAETRLLLTARAPRDRASTHRWRARPYNTWLPPSQAAMTSPRSPPPASRRWRTGRAGRLSSS